MGGKRDDVRIPIGEQQEETSIEREDMGRKKDDVNTPVRDQQEQPSTDQGPSSSTSPAANKLRDVDKRLIAKIKGAEKPKRRKAENDEGSQTRIQKFPESVLNKEKPNGYSREPKAIAIGPFYAGDDSLKREDIKHRLTLRFIRNSGKDEETFLTEFKEKFTVDELKKVFKEKVNKGREGKLVRMFFLDGCSVLQFMDSYVNNGIEESDEVTNGKADLIRHDLLLLENQIPFKVLVILMRLSNKGVELAKSIYRFISMNIMAPAKCYKPRLDQNIDKLPGDQKQLFQEDNNVPVPVHLLDLLRSELLFGIDSSQSSINEQNEGAYYELSFRNIQDLKEVGIKLKPDYSSGLRSVSFSSPLFIFGQLKLPPLIVDNSTEQKLLNLVDYEMCPGANYKKNYTVTSYLRLLDSLIDSEEDVKALRSAHILRNHLSSDKEVAQLFNSLGSFLVPHDAYSSVKIEIQNFYDWKIASWKAQFCSLYCRNPWTMLALLAALAAFILTGIQTYYSVNPKKE